MASKKSASLALFLALNLLFFTLTTACGGGCGPSPKPKPKPTRRLASPAMCPIDNISKFSVCANVLQDLLGAKGAKSPTKPCCSLIQSFADLDAAVCLCTAIKAKLLGDNLDIPDSISRLLNVCSKKVPSGFKCT